MTDPGDHIRQVDDIADGPDPDIDAGPPETDDDRAEADRLAADANAGQQGDWQLHDGDTDDAALLDQEHDGPAEDGA